MGTGILLESEFIDGLCELPEGIYIHKSERDSYDPEIKIKCNAKARGVLLEIIIRSLDMEINFFSPCFPLRSSRSTHKRNYRYHHYNTYRNFQNEI